MVINHSFSSYSVYTVRLLATLIASFILFTAGLKDLLCLLNIDLRFFSQTVILLSGSLFQQLFFKSLDLFSFLVK